MSDLEVGKTEPQCNCPSMRDVFREGVGTKPPCPVHDDPEFVTKMILLPNLFDTLK